MINAVNYDYNEKDNTINHGIEIIDNYYVYNLKITHNLDYNISSLLLFAHRDTKTTIISYIISDISKRIEINNNNYSIIRVMKKDNLFSLKSEELDVNNKKIVIDNDEQLNKMINILLNSQKDLFNKVFGILQDNNYLKILQQYDVINDVIYHLNNNINYVEVDNIINKYIIDVDNPYKLRIEKRGK